LVFATRTCRVGDRVCTVGAVPVLGVSPGSCSSIVSVKMRCHQVDADYTLGDQILEYLVHHGLESGWTVGETKEHDQGSNSPRLCGMRPSTHRLPSPDIVVSPPTSSLVK